MTGVNILVIEDNNITRKLYCTTLRNEGYTVFEADSGQKAIEILKQITPDLILQDLMLPDMDGFELNRLIRALPDTTDIPIIAISGLLMKMDHADIIKGGFSNFLIKPINTSELLSLINMNLLSTNINPVEQGNGKTVLIADDNEAQLRLLLLHLKHSDYQVIIAKDGQDAMEKALQHHPDAIISDVLMPKMDGFDLCMQVRRQPALMNVPMILVTSHYIEEVDRELAKKVGANSYVMRTADSQEILNALNTTLKSGQHYSTPLQEQIFKDEHALRLMNQLERQVANNVRLAKQCALQTAQLAISQGVTDALINRKEIQNVLRDVLAVYLDAAGISYGILYLVDKHDDILKLNQHIGYDERQAEQLADFFGEISWLTVTMDKQRITRIPSSDIPATTAKEILDNTHSSIALVVPLIAGNKNMGVIFLGYHSVSMAESDISFAHLLGTHLSELISLTDTLDMLTVSESRFHTLMENVSCGIMVHDEHGIILEINKYGELLFSLKKDQLIGRDFKDFISSSEREKIDKLLKESICDQSSCHLSYRLASAMKNEMTVDAVISCLRLDNENVFLSILNKQKSRKKT